MGMAVVVVLLRFVLTGASMRAGRAARTRLTGDTTDAGSTIGTYVVAGPFAASGVAWLVIFPTGAGEHGLPHWVTGVVMISLGIVLVVLRHRRR